MHSNLSIAAPNGALTISLFFICLFGLSLGNRLYSSDAYVMFETSREIAFNGQVSLPQDYGLPQIRRGDDGAYYSQYDPGLPLLAAPAVRLADAIAQPHFWNRYATSSYAVMWLSPMAVGVGLGLLYTIAGHFFRRRDAALGVVIVAGLATSLWVYGQLFFAEGLLSLLLTTGLWASYRAEWRWVLLGGVALALAILTRAAMVIYLLPMLWLLWRTRSWQKMAAFLGLASLGVLGLLVHNVIRSGDPLRFGYGGQGFDTPLYEGVFGLLLSPGKSIFLYAPPLVLSVIYFPQFLREVRPLALALLMSTLIALVFYGSWWAWHGGWSWSPRFLVPLIPLWCVPLGYALKNGGWRTRFALVLLALAGFFINGAAVITDVNRHYSTHGMVNYSLAHTPILSAWEAIGAGHTEPLGSFHLAELGWQSLLATLFPLALAFGGVICMRQVLLDKTTHE